MFFFESVKCWPEIYRGKYLLEWTGYSVDDISFDVYAQADGGVEVKLLSGIDTLSCTAETGIQNLSFDNDLGFRIEATTPSGEKNSSNTFYPSSVLDKKDRLMYREMIRRLDLDLKKFIGKQDGVLLRQKKYGSKAKNVNPVLDAPIGIEDKNSYGKKFDGGYLPGVKLRFGFLTPPTGTQKSQTTENGKTDIRQVSIVTYPLPTASTGDLWVDIATNNRYTVVGREQPTFYGAPRKQQLVLSLLPVSDPAYNVSI